MKRIYRKVRDIMLPLSKYSVVSYDATLREVILHIKNAYCDSRERVCNRAGPRIVFVADDSGNLLGMIELKMILKVLIPEVTGGVGEKFSIQAVSVAFAEADAVSHDETRSAFLARVRRNSEKKVSEIMKKIDVSLQAEDYIFKAISLFMNRNIESVPVYDHNNRLVGVLRDRDIFILITHLLT